MGFPGGSGVQNLSAIAGHTGSIPGTGRSPGERNGKPRQYSCQNVKNSFTDRNTRALYLSPDFLCTGEDATVRRIHGTTDWFKIGKGV